MSTQDTLSAHQTTSALPAGVFNDKGEFQRPASIFRSFVSKAPGAQFPSEKDRYHLYVSYACPWAHRTLIVRKLKGLEAIIPVTVVHYHVIMTGDVRSWRFVSKDEALPGEDVTPDPLHLEFQWLRELYLKADPNYQGRFTVPVLWDKKQEAMVSNESSEILRMMYTEFDHLLPEIYQKIGLYPEAIRSKIDETNVWTYDDINNGVYKCGIARNRSAYHTTVTSLFDSLDRVEAHLSSNIGPYYFGSQITEADVRLYVTLIRFDPVYVSLFKTNKKMIRHGYPKIHEYMRRLYWQVRAFHETTIFEHIKPHYFMSLVMLNPAGVVPEGPMPHVLPL